MPLLPDEKQDSRVELAIQRYQTEDISLARAAYLAGMSFEGMERLLIERGVPLRLGPADEQEALQEIEEMQRISGTRGTR
jgi:predicted HTH domain antitoxin